MLANVPAQATAADVALGYMVRSLTSTYKTDVGLLESARRSWMVDAGPRLDVLLLVDCAGAASDEAQLRPPAELDAANPRLPRLHLRCFRLREDVSSADGEVTAAPRRRGTVPVAFSSRDRLWRRC